MDKIDIALVGLYRYQNFPIRIMHSLLENIDGIKPSSIFFKNSETNIFNKPTAREEDLFVDIIGDLNPRLVGISILSPYFRIAQRLTRLIKENSKSLVIWGGVLPTLFPECCINEADMLCIGEGEGVIVDLAKHLRDGKPYHSIENLWIRDGQGIIKNSMRPLIQDLDSLPFPVYAGNSCYFIDSNRTMTKDPVLFDNYCYILASRGCPYSCSYCVNSLLRPLFRKLGPYTRRRSVSNVICEIKNKLNTPGNRSEYVDFVDESFASDKVWVEEFEVSYKKEIGLPFCVEYNPKNINTMVLDRLVNAGIDMVNFGIQTGCDYIRNNIFHRPGTNNEIIGIAREIKKHNIRIKYDLILDNPYDTEDSLKRTIKLLLRLPKPLFFNLFSLQYFPNYPLTKKALEDKHIKSEETNFDNLNERTTKNWAFVPKLFPYTNKQILQNIIWLITDNQVKDRMVKFSIFGNSAFSKFCLIYLNFKAIMMSRLWGAGGIARRNVWILYFINGIKYLLKGDFKTAYLKIRKHMGVK